MPRPRRETGGVFRYREMSPDVEAVIRAKLDPLADLVPAWCDHVNVFLRDGDGEEDANILVHYEYRFAMLRIYSSWLRTTPQSQVDVLAHELTHITLDPLATWAKDTIERLTVGQKMLRSMLVAEFDQREEMVTQDLTFRRLGRFGSPPSEGEPQRRPWPEAKEKRRR